MNSNIYDQHNILETSAARLTLGYTISLEDKQATRSKRLHYLFIAVNQLMHGKFFKMLVDKKQTWPPADTMTDCPQAAGMNACLSSLMHKRLTCSSSNILWVVHGRLIQWHTTIVSQCKENGFHSRNAKSIHFIL